MGTFEQYEDLVGPVELAVEHECELAELVSLVEYDQSWSDEV